MVKMEEICMAVVPGDMESALVEVQALAGAGVSPGTVLEGGLIPAMAEVGRLF